MFAFDCKKRAELKKNLIQRTSINKGKEKSENERDRRRKENVKRRLKR